MSADDPKAAPSLADNGALVLLSGGQDSATCLAWALDRFARVETIGFRYGQPHAIELEVRGPVIESVIASRPSWRERIGQDHCLDLSGIMSVMGTPRSDSLPATFVLGRNLLFFTYAAIVAERRNIKHLVGGMCETDYSGYPDCRDDTLKALQATLNLGMSTRCIIHTPLMWLTKAQTWWMAADLGGEALVENIRIETHSCYRGDRSILRDFGYGCGDCDACTLRSNGWSRFCRDLAS